MTISVLDVRDTFLSPHVRTPKRPAIAAVPTKPRPTRRRLPVAVLAGGLIGILESVGLLAVALTGLDGALTSAVRPAAWMIALGLVVLAAWVVLSAGSGAALIDGSGRTLLMGLAYAEMVLVAAVLVVATAVPFFVPPAGLSLPAVALLALAVPVGKLLLAGTPSARQWIAAGPRSRERRADPVATHRVLATLTLGVIGVSLGALAVLSPVQGAGTGAPASSVVYQP